MMNTNTVSFQLMNIIITRLAMIRIGNLIREKSEAITEDCTSWTSPDSRAMMSPLRSVVKNPTGSVRILAYISRRMSRTTPFCIGIVNHSEK